MSSHQDPEHSGETITYFRVEPYGDGVLILTSEAVDTDGRLDPLHSETDGGLSPPLAWTAPPGVVSYALVVEDPDAPSEQPAVHWMMWNIPGDVHFLPAGIGNGLDVEDALGLIAAVQGRNVAGGYGWRGMAPPAGHGPHRYYFQMFALDRRIEFGPEAGLEDLVHVLKAGTLAKGLLIGLFETPDRLTVDPEEAP